MVTIIYNSPKTKVVGFAWRRTQRPTPLPNPRDVPLRSRSSPMAQGEQQISPGRRVWLSSDRMSFKKNRCMCFCCFLRVVVEDVVKYVYVFFWWLSKWTLRWLQFIPEPGSVPGNSWNYPEISKQRSPTPVVMSLQIRIRDFVVAGSRGLSTRQIRYGCFQK